MSKLGRIPDHAPAGLGIPIASSFYGLPTPNGVKVSIALEELGLPYEPHLVDIMKDANKAPDYVALNPNAEDPLHPRSRWPGRRSRSSWSNRTTSLCISPRRPGS